MDKGKGKGKDIERKQGSSFGGVRKILTHIKTRTTSGTAKKNLPQTSSTSNKPLELHIHTARVGLYPNPPTTITDNRLAHSAMSTSSPDLSYLSRSSIFTCLLSGPLDEFLLYSGREQSGQTKWLIDIAHDICDPAMKRGSLQVWDAAGETWRDVNPTDPLTPSSYLYNIQVVVSLTKISVRTGRSRTSTTGNASTMADRVNQRDDGKCWVTRYRGPNRNSHVCPKRMGDLLLRIIYSNFVSNPPPPGLSIYGQECGITLGVALDAWFDVYEFGLRFVAPDQYECHSFLPPDWPPGPEWRRTVAGTGFESNDTLHGYRASPPRSQDVRNPPPGLIRWHYLQCVIRKFAHSDFRDLPNVAYYQLPLRMEGDSDDEGTDSDYEWPSAALDRGRAMQMEIEYREDRQRCVTEWVTTAS